MSFVVEKNNAPVAFIYRNVIINIHSNNVSGLILGSYVFCTKGKAIGKFFKNKFRNKQGYIIAEISAKSYERPVLNDRYLTAVSWEILKVVTVHELFWVPEINEWAKIEFTDFLKVA
jgi:hypothetical protein